MHSIVSFQIKFASQSANSQELFAFYRLHIFSHLTIVGAGAGAGAAEIEKAGAGAAKTGGSDNTALNIPVPY